VSSLSFQCRHRFVGGFTLDVQFESEHRVTSLFGPSGSGKTSVLGMIAGIVRPQQGTIRIGERTLVDTAERVHLAPERRHVGFVFQDHLLFPHMTVTKNLCYGRNRRRGYRRGRDRFHRRSVEFDRVVEVLELGELLDRRPRNLAGGERQRVALGRALLCAPDLLLMDEPLAAVDEELKLRVLSYLERVVDEWSIPTLYVSHNQAEVHRLADWVIVMQAGRVIGSGTPGEALSQPATLGLKNSTGPVNLLRIESAACENGQWLGRVGEQSLSLPPLDEPLPSPLFVECAPGEVMLSREEIDGVSTRNQLRGTVRQLVPVPEGVFVAVDVGQVVWSEVTPNAVRDLGLQTGTPVTCLIKTHSLKPVR
jgi:molybdate transport system ATP-binding protein